MSLLELELCVSCARIFSLMCSSVSLHHLLLESSTCFCSLDLSHQTVSFSSLHRIIVSSMKLERWWTLKSQSIFFFGSKHVQKTKELYSCISLLMAEVSGQEKWGFRRALCCCAFILWSEPWEDYHSDSIIWRQLPCRGPSNWNIYVLVPEDSGDKIRLLQISHSHYLCPNKHEIKLKYKSFPNPYQFPIWCLPITLHIIIHSTLFL